MKYTVCISMDEELQEKTITGLNRFPFAENDTLEFIHIFEEESYSYILPPVVYPLPDQRDDIKESIKKIMHDIRNKVSTLDQTKTLFHCFFHQSPRSMIIDYLKESSSELVFVATRGKHGIQGLFTSSFADHLLKFSPCSVFVIR